MTMSDPLGDMLTRIRNGQRARHAVVAAPASKHRANVLEVLKREGYIRGYTHQQVRPGVAELKIELKYVDGEPVIREISRPDDRDIAPRSVTDPTLLAVENPGVALALGRRGQAP